MDRGVQVRPGRFPGPGCRQVQSDPAGGAGQPGRHVQRPEQGDRQVGLPLVGESGLLVAFDSNLTHAVTPVTHGERYTVVTWLV